MGAEVVNSVITLDSADGTVANTRKRSSALTLVDAHEYQVQFGVQDGGAGVALGAKLIGI